MTGVQTCALPIYLGHTSTMPHVHFRTRGLAQGCFGTVIRVLEDFTHLPRWDHQLMATQVRVPNPRPLR